MSAPDPTAPDPDPQAPDPESGDPERGDPGHAAAEADGARALEREARLARLSVPADRRAAVDADRERILAAFESLQAVDVSGIDPLHQPLVGTGAERDTRTALPAADAALEPGVLLERAPRAADDHFAVPKTVDA